MARYSLLLDGDKPAWQQQARAYRNPAIIALTVLVFTICLLIWLPSHLPFTGASHVLSGGGSCNLLEDARNATLGFQKLLVVNFPDRSDKRDKMSIMAATTGLHFDYIPGVPAEDVPNKAMPPGAEGWLGGVRGSWRAHINALRSIVEQNLTTAVIFEDDLDWDLRIREQMHDYAATTRALNQPLKSNPSTFADPTFPDVPNPTQAAPQLSSTNLPETIPPQLTPYGDNWDILWLGHCGMRRPRLQLGDGVNEDWLNISGSLPKGVVVTVDDVTVPRREDLHWWHDGPFEEFRHNFPPHTRLTHHAVGAVCTFAYAVTQHGARKILYELGLMQMNDPFDLMLRDFCDRKRGHEGNGAICLTVQPSLFSHFIKKDGEGETGYRKTVNLRWSTYLNLPKLLRGETDFEDQWPPGEDDLGLRKSS